MAWAVRQGSQLIERYRWDFWRVVHSRSPRVNGKQESRLIRANEVRNPDSPAYQRISDGTANSARCFASLNPRVTVWWSGVDAATIEHKPQHIAERDCACGLQQRQIDQRVHSHDA